MILCAGCGTDLPYTDPADPGQSENSPTASSGAETPTAASEAELAAEQSTEGSTEQSTEEVPTPAPGQAPQDDPNLAESLFGEIEPEDQPPRTGPAQATSPPATPPASSDSLPLLPWETEDDRYARADREATAPPTEPAKPAGGESSAEPSLPWETPSEAAPSETPTQATAPLPSAPPQAATPAASSEPSGPVAAQRPPSNLDLSYPEPELPLPPPEEPPALPELEGPEDLPPPFDARQSPGDTPPVDSSSADPLEELSTQQVAWLLGSKWSYWMLAPAGEAEGVKHEIEPLAALLGITLPALERPARGTAAEVAAEVLATSRKWGDQIAQRFGPDHAALVEVAVKSNVLLAIYTDRPHLVHAIGGSVAAASVRAGLPEEIWQPWQDRVVAGGPAEGIHEAVLQLHDEVQSHLRHPTNDTAHAIRR